jgi:hypothetical protein
MPSTPRGRNAATVLAVVLTIVLALAWLHSSDGGAPLVPPGLSVDTVPAVVPEEPAVPAPSRPEGSGDRAERTGGRLPLGEAANGAGTARRPRLGGRRREREERRRGARRSRRRRDVDRADDGEGARARREGRALGRAGTSRRDSPGTAPAPSVGGADGGSWTRAPRRSPPEFALG